MKCMRPVLIVLCSLLVLPSFARAADEDIAALMAEGDTYSAAWDYENAAIAYMKVLKIDSLNYEALWKAGDMYTELADALDDKQKGQKETFFEKAAELCSKAVEVKPEGWEGHFKLSVVYGRLGLFRGGKEKVKLAQKVRAEAEKAIELNPNSDLAIHVLARWHQNVANLSGILKFFAKTLYGEELKGSNEEAVRLFKRAIEIDPEHIEHYLELAKTYELMKRKDLMREPLEKVLALPVKEHDDAEFKKEAEELLKKLD